MIPSKFLYVYILWQGCYILHNGTLTTSLTKNKSSKHGEHTIDCMARNYTYVTGMANDSKEPYLDKQRISPVSWYMSTF